MSASSVARKPPTYDGQRGMTLIEVLIALAVLGLVAVVFLGGASTGLKSVTMTDERVIAESLARSELEYVMSLLYDATNNPPAYSIDPNLAMPSGYAASVQTVRLDPVGNGTGDDDGLQNVTVTITHNAQTALQVNAYKANR